MTISLSQTLDHLKESQLCLLSDLKQEMYSAGEKAELFRDLQLLSIAVSQIEMLLQSPDSLSFRTALRF
jgi:hypothetical protein